MEKTEFQIQPFWKNRWFVAPVAAFFVAGIFLKIWIPAGEEILLLNHWRVEPLNSIFRMLTHCGEGWAFFAVGLPLLFFRWRFAILLAVGGLLTMPISFFSKDKIAVDRPKTHFENLGKWEQVVVVPEVELASGRTSFPSGHAMAGFVLWSLVASFLPRKFEKWAAAAAFLAILVAVSRVFLVQHFLADILGGAVFGLAFAFLILKLDKKIQQKTP